MLLRIPDVLNALQVRQVRGALDAAGDAWVDGRATAGHQGAQVKRNLQIAEDAPVAGALGEIVLGALERHPLFLSAALPARIYPPMFNRYESADTMQFGRHVDGAVRLLPHTGVKLRTDISATLFISPPEEYDGGELHVHDTYGAHSVKLPAGDLVLYPATGVHHVTPVTRGARIGCFFWVHSLVRDDAQRALLFDLDMAIVRLTQDAAGHESLVPLTGTYHNLLRMWAEP
jgi:PKHD-type hydroxylase